MPVGYLVFVALVATHTFFAARPPRRPPVMAALGFRLGLVVSELPYLAFTLLAASTLLAVVQGDASSPGGLVGVAVACLAAVGLALIAVRQFRTAEVVDRALRDGLGPIRRERPAGARARMLRYARVLCAPLPMRGPAAGSRSVRRVSGLAYGDVGRRNRLDVYHHRLRPSGAPVLIHMHGGHYRHGRKSSQSLPLIHRLARHGWVCVSANYRLRPYAQHPDHLVDLKKVIAWVREHAHEYGADPGSVFVAGSSAGAHMAALAALTPGDPAFQPGFEEADTSVSGAICLGGYYGEYFGQDASSSPMSHVRADAPPFLIVHGDQDTLVPVEAARLFAETLRRVSRSAVVYVEPPRAQHAFDLFHSVRFEALIDGIEDFAAWARADAQASGQAGGPAGARAGDPTSI